jgi:prepilin-type N-terminal cleavage/methylation domain-containing protein
MPRARRSGFTLIELAIVLVAGGVVAAAIAGVLRRQQRFFVNASALLEQRVHLREATGILPGELRALAPGGGDVLAFSDSSLEIRATIGAAVACDTLTGGSGLDLAPPRLASGAELAAFTSAPQPGDIALVWDQGATDRATDDMWARVEVAATSPVAGACAASPLLDPLADAAAPRLRLLFTPGAGLPSTVRPGAFVRVVRRVRYRLYRSATGDWYLGYSEWGGSAFGGVQPVSGPFASYARGGLSLRYFDDASQELAAGSGSDRIARITVVARGVSRVGLAGEAAAAGDSQSVSVRVRNR